jgi:transcriptional regulator with XRE-family HTH domain
MKQNPSRRRRTSSPSRASYDGEDIIHRPQDMGDNLRKLRVARDASLQSAANAIGVSKSFLSMVESGQRVLQFEDLLRLLHYYRYSFARFLTDTRDEMLKSALDEPMKNAVNAVVRAPSDALLMLGDRNSTRAPRILLLRPLRSPDDSEWLEIALPPYSQLTEKPLQFKGEARGVVQRGTLLLILNNDEYRAKEGSEFCFEGSNPHIFRNYLDQPLIFTLIITPAAL